MPCLSNSLGPCLIDSRVTRIPERSSGINPAATRGFRGEYLVGDVTGVAVTGVAITRYATPGDRDDTATDVGGDVTNEDGGESTPGNVVGGNTTPEDVAGGTEDVAGGTEDVVRGPEDVAGGPEDIAGGPEDITGDNTASETSLEATPLQHTSLQMTSVKTQQETLLLARSLEETKCQQLNQK